MLKSTKKPSLSFTKRTSITTCATALAAVAPFIAHSPKAIATEDNSFVLEEIIITAQKRDQSMQDVPISVAAMPGDTIQNKGLTKLEDISGSIPSLHVGEAQVTSQIFIRGIGSGVNAGFEQSVGTYVDGIYYGRGRQSRGTLFDIQRVEVLKGPQGTLFGKNTIAGAMNIITADPTDELEGFVSALYEFEHDETIMEGVFSGPLNDSLSARLSLRWSEMNEGWIRNSWRHDGEPQSETQMARLGLRWTPTEDLEALTKITINNFEQEGRNSELTDVNGFYPGGDSMAALLAPFGEIGKKDGKRLVGGTEGTLFDRDESDNDIASYLITVNYNLGEHTLTSVTGYTEYDFTDAQDNDVTPFDILAMESEEDYEQFSQEIRITSPLDQTLDYILGAYYQRDNLDTTQFINTNLLDLQPGPPIFSSRLANMSQDTESWAVFAQLTWNISETVRTTLGLRYAEDEKEVEQEMRLTEFANPNSPLATLSPPASGVASGAVQVSLWESDLGSFEHVINADRKEEHFTPAISVQWDITPEVMLYTSVSTGYKGGGFDAYFGRSSGIFSSAPDGFEFEDEEVIAYEFGAKATLLNGAAELNVALFYNEFDDVQVSTFDGGLSLRVGNAAETVVEGLELDGRWRLTESLTTSFSLAYIDAYYDTFKTAQCYVNQSPNQCFDRDGNGLPEQDLSGKSLQFSPDWSAHINFEYVLSLADSLELITSLDVSHSDEYAIAADLDPRFVQEAFTKVDLRVALTESNGSWELAFIGKNLTDEDSSTWANDTPLANGSGYRHIDRLRSYAVQGTYRF